MSSEGALERDEHEENVVAVARHMRENGHTIRAIVEFFRELGIVGRRGKPICTTRVFEMIHGGRKKRLSTDSSPATAPARSLVGLFQQPREEG